MNFCNKILAEIFVAQICFGDIRTHTREAISVISLSVHIGIKLNKFVHRKSRLPTGRLFFLISHHLGKSFYYKNSPTDFQANVSGARYDGFSWSRRKKIPSQRRNLQILFDARWKAHFGGIILLGSPRFLIDDERQF